MQLKRIYVNQLRQFREPLEIQELTAGLNLFCGANESGKSSLVRAIRAAFFERHKSSSIDDLQPWGDTSASPRVELDFAVDGKLWRLSKAFLKQKRCDLSIDGREYSGDEAEEKIADLLGYQLPARGASKAEHWGIPGLLWIEQGTGQAVRQPVAHAADHLKSALGASAGEVASSSGDWLLERVAAERAELLTSTGKPTKEYREALAEYEKLQPEIESLADEVAAYTADVDRLGDLRNRQQADRDRPWEDYRRRQQEARQQLQAIEALMELQSREESALNACGDLIRLLEDRLQQFSSQLEELATRRIAVQNATRQLQDLQSRTAGLQSAVDRARQNWQQSTEQLERSRHRELRAQYAEQLQRLGPAIQEIEVRIAEATKLKEQVDQQQARLREVRIDSSQLQQLESMSSDLRDLNLRKQSIATRLQFELLPGRRAQLDGRALQGTGEQLLLQTAQLEIDGVGHFTIQPGGADLADLAREQQKLEADLGRLSQLMEVASLSDARQRAQQAQELESDLRLGQTRLLAIAPGGVAALSEELQQLALSRGQLQNRMDTLPDGDDGVPAPTTAVAQQNLAASEKSLKEIEARLTQHQTSIQLAQQSKDSALREQQELERSIHSPERQAREQQAREELYSQQAAAKSLQEAIAQRAPQIDAAQPQLLRNDIERYGQAADNLESAANHRRTEINRLQTVLETLGARGLEETLALKQVEYRRLGRRVEELGRRAQALDLLLNLLRDKRQQLTRRLQQPLQVHLQHYLHLLFPGASLQVDEDLMPELLVREGQRGAEYEDIETLSFGAREQMGLISRLAYADLLQEAGRPTLIILDDALVHSDAHRLEQMKRILFDAARRHQVLLFTCHPDNWRDMGVAREMHTLSTLSRQP